jgi:hypothetical protein
MAMKADSLACRGCGRTPEQTRTPVAPGSTAYTSSRCLMGGAVSPATAGARTPPQDAPNTSLETGAVAGTSAPLFRDGRAGRRGRPRVPVSEQQRKAKERARRYRHRRRATVA